jgi:hypothetical protein
MSSVVISGDTSGSVTLAAPAVSGSTVLTLPATSGTVLTTASGQWITTGSDIYYNTGNVGIGTASPSKKLHVYRNDTGQDAQIQIEQAGSGSPTLGFLETGVYAWLIGQYGSDNSFRIAASGADLNTSPRLTIDTSGNLQFNSGYGSAATAYGCRAWVNFNGTGTIAIRGSGGVTSLTDNGTGSYTINLTTAMPDTNYAGLISSSGGQAFLLSTGANPNTTTTFRVETSNSAGTLTDATYISVALFR